MSDIVALLKQTQLGQLAELTQQTLADRFETVSLVRDEVLFRQDDPGDSLYLVVEGQLEVLLRDPEGGGTLWGRWLCLPGKIARP